MECENCVKLAKGIVKSYTGPLGTLRNIDGQTMCTECGELYIDFEIRSKGVTANMEPDCWRMVYSAIRLLWMVGEQTRHDNRYTRSIKSYSEKLTKLYQDGL